MMEEVFLTKEKFTREVEDLIQRASCSVLEAIVLKVEEKGLEIEKAKKFLTSNLIEKLEAEMVELKLVKGSDKNTLQF